MIDRWRLARTVCLLTAAAALAGCGTAIHITSEPSGARVFARGSGRASFPWRDKGTTPALYKSWYNAELTRVRWPDGTVSEIRRIPLLGRRDVSIHFDQRVAPARPSPADR